ncbi:MAG TPA: sensor histidine kinase [Rhodanobacteraceae bacterium]|nr:sensor histidine kinase [Rhodanobacteraceae bacterium]
MFFKIAPDSVMEPGYPRNRWIPVVMLVWSTWIFATPVFSGKHGWLWPTLASFAVFLLLYWRAYFGPKAHVLWCALGMAALACVLMPINDGGWCYAIYSCAFIAFTGPTPRVAMWRMLALNVAFTIELAFLQAPWIFIGTSILVSMAVGIMNVFFRRNQQQDAELRLSHDEVRRLAATAERERIGRDLHDLLGHTLSLVAVKSELAKRLLERDDRQAARREIAEVERVAREALAQVRSAVTGIRAAALISELASARLLLESAGVAFEYRAPESPLPAEAETALALALREAVTNIQRHARATHAEAAFAFEDHKVRMRVRDDGRGGIGAHGNGLTGMRERIEAMNGTLSIRSERGQGTELEIALPMPAAETKPVKELPRPSTEAPALRHA